METTECHSAFGHVCRGTDALIENSPINIHIHIHTEDASVAQKIGRIINGLFGQRHKTIENASQLSKDELQGRICREVQD